LYNKTCSMGSTALWSAQSIFENHAFWFDVDRGLFIYTNNQSGEDFYFPQKISDYCEANQDLCRQYGWQAIICTDNDLDSYNQSASGCGVADCNDANLSINPGATEICDGLDNNCVNGIDEGVFTIYYKDNDSDSFGNITSSQQACTQPLGYVASNTDCNDNNALEKPGQIWYRDIDDDGHSDGSTLTQCPRPISYKVASELIATGGDCDDLNSTINPEAMDNTCDGINNDCDAQTDEGYTPTATSCGLGQCTNNTGQLICSSGTLTDTCDSFGGATMESCEDNSGYDNIDNNCDGVVDLDCSAYCDQDQDNYSPNLICLLGGYFVGDCDDTNAGINPGTSELCDNVDNDCSSGSVDGSDEAWYGQATNCGLGQCTNTGQLTCQSGSQVNTCTPGAPSEEICDGLDNNCDVTIDNGNNLLCDNGQFCDGNEICGGTSGCQVGTVPCNPATHTCIEATDSCQLLPGTCTTNADCSDGIFCNGAESCVGGSCIAGTQVVCNDNITCTIDSCNEVDGCLFTENHAGCQDGQYCNGVESCSIANLGCISGTPVTCAPDLFSCTDDKCNEAIDSCQNIENSTNCPLYSQGQICSITNFPDPTGTGCGFVQNCVDADNDGLLDYNINKCPLGKDYCDYTNKTYFENNPSQLNNYLPEKGDYNVSEVNSSNVLNHSEFRIILGNIGEIMFKMDLNLIRINETGCFEKLDFNLSELIKIENNKIFLNSSMHSEFSKPAKLIFQNINFAQPKILRDGAECSSSACLIINYSNNILEVDVPGFSFYEVVEGFISPPPGDGSGGGGGGTTPRACIVEWTCTSWSDCINGTQIRSCSDNNNCTAQSNKPTERQECRLTTGIVTNETAIAPGNIVRETIKWFTEKALIILIVVLTVVLIAIIIVLTATRSRKTEEKKIF
ncbi:putative metal-binding motif-containing protein, partial [Candidatus Pacearchaeota archaeon]|nr:putative metal-binding motif-containing protein [Candidatus Pacearchaeota archaeon]